MDEKKNEKYTRKLMRVAEKYRGKEYKNAGVANFFAVAAPLLREFRRGGKFYYQGAEGRPKIVHGTPVERLKALEKDFTYVFLVRDGKIVAIAPYALIAGLDEELAKKIATEAEELSDEDYVRLAGNSEKNIIEKLASEPGAVKSFETIASFHNIPIINEMVKEGAEVYILVFGPNGVPIEDVEERIKYLNLTFPEKPEDRITEAVDKDAIVVAIEPETRLPLSISLVAAYAFMPDLVKELIEKRAVKSEVEYVEDVKKFLEE